MKNLTVKRKKTKIIKTNTTRKLTKGKLFKLTIFSDFKNSINNNFRLRFTTISKNTKSLKTNDTNG